MREVGISKITMFPILTNNSSGITFGTPFAVPWAISLETENQYSESAYHGDNQIERQNKKITRVDVTMEVSSDTSPLLDSKITGKGYANGGAYTQTGQNPTPHALAYEILMDDNNIRRRVIYNVSLTRDSQTNQTVEDSQTAQTYEYSGFGLPTTQKGYVEFTMDKAEIEAMEGADKSKILALFNNFFTSVVLPDTPLTEGV